MLRRSFLIGAASAVAISTPALALISAPPETCAQLIDYLERQFKCELGDAKFFHVDPGHWPHTEVWRRYVAMTSNGFKREGDPIGRLYVDERVAVRAWLAKFNEFFIPKNVRRIIWREMPQYHVVIPDHCPDTWPQMWDSQGGIVYSRLWVG